MIDRFTFDICACCARDSAGFGYTPKHGQPALIVCDDPQCLQIARETYHMKQDTFTRIERLAVEKGGEEAGEFLDAIGRTDLSTMTSDEWGEFCRRLVAGYRNALISGLKNEAPF